MDHELILFGRADCHLCDEARAVLREVAGEFGVDWEEVDVDSDPELRAEYGSLVPVLLVDGEEHSVFRIDPGHLRTALETGMGWADRRR